MQVSGAEMCLNIAGFIIVDAHRQLTPNASVRTIQIAIITRCSTPIAAVSYPLPTTDLQVSFIVRGIRKCTACRL
jgi:hypothetical protein